MAIARLTFTMLDGSRLDASFKVAESYPDALDQAGIETVKLFRAGLVEIGAGEGNGEVAAPDA